MVLKKIYLCLKNPGCSCKKRCSEKWCGESYKKSCNHVDI